MKILLLGSNGQVGWELQRVLWPLGEIICPGRDQLDLARSGSLENFLQTLNVDVIVNAAAYTAVDKAESESEIAQRINHVVPGLLAEKAKAIKALLIHYSTDYVFDGNKSSPYHEADDTAPLGVYGKTKLDGENIIRDMGCDHLIFRTSWVYAARGHNFLLTILKLAQQRQELNIVDDQIGTPTWARLIAQTTAYCLHQAVHERKSEVFSSGLFHLTASGSTSWHGFALTITRFARHSGAIDLALKQLNPIPTSAYPTPAKRPATSRLDVSHLENHFELVMPDWYQTLQLCMDEFKWNNLQS